MPIGMANRNTFVIALFFAVLISGCGSESSTTPQADQKQSADISGLQAISSMMPAAEKQFIAVAKDYAEKYKNADNELKKSSVWKERSSALRKIPITKNGEKFSGILDDMGTTGNGDAYIVVRIDDEVTLSTWNNAFSDISDKTLIKNGSKEYTALSAMKKGDAIAFSAQIKMDGKGITEEGKMTEPDFATRFTNISPLHATPPR